MAKVVALDWGSDDSIITCHLEYEDGSVEKKYPNKEYGDDIVLRPHIVRGVYRDDIFRVCGGEFAQGYWEYNQILIADNYTSLELLENSEYVNVLGNVYENPELLK